MDLIDSKKDAEIRQLFQSLKGKEISSFCVVGGKGYILVTNSTGEQSGRIETSAED